MKFLVCSRGVNGQGITVVAPFMTLGEKIQAWFVAHSRAGYLRGPGRSDLYYVPKA